MANLGRYEKKPRPESIALLLKYLSEKSFISSITTISDQIHVLERIGRSTLRIYLTNHYIVGLAEVWEILAEDESVNAIITMSAWNSYTPDAKAYCAERNIGLFKFKEFMGAVYQNGANFINYVPKKSDW